MLKICLLLCPVSFVLTYVLSVAMRAVGRRARAFDSPATQGRVKEASRAIPNLGGVAIFMGLAGPIIAGMVAATLAPDALVNWLPILAPYLEGIQKQAPLGFLFVGCLTLLHVIGVIDDRRPLDPFLKLGFMILPALAMATIGQTRMFTFLDAGDGLPILSIAITVVWFVIITNALNFMDNMDGLCAGVAAMVAAFLLFGAAQSEQWFVAATLSLLLGACLGFLMLNRPPATLFMGDGGSLVLGFALATLTVRATYIGDASAAIGSDPSLAYRWYAVLTPLVVLAVPLYDFITVVTIRISQGRSPFVGDLQHLSHRLVRRGLSKSAAVGTVVILTVVTGVSGLLLMSASPVGAALIALQTIAVLAVTASLEFGGTGRAGT